MPLPNTRTQVFCKDQWDQRYDTAMPPSHKGTVSFLAVPVLIQPRHGAPENSEESYSVSVPRGTHVRDPSGVPGFCLCSDPALVVLGICGSEVASRFLYLSQKSCFSNK